MIKIIAAITYVSMKIEGNTGGTGKWNGYILI